MTRDRTAYRQIMKATSIFGGVQVVNIVIKIISSKFIAILLGPAGIGIIGLLNSTISLLAGMTNFGLGTSAVKNVAEANGTGDSMRVAIIITVLRRWVWMTGFLGFSITLFLSPWLSTLTFGNSDYTYAFAWISITLLFNQISSGQIVLLQGLRKIKYLANANLTGALIGLFVSVPIYFMFRVDGIVPAIIVTSLANMLRSWYFSSKIKIEIVSIDAATTIAEGKDMLKMGFIISMSGLISVGASYIVRMFISRIGGVDQVGLYTAGFAIINTYVGLIFTAMGTDYYPRLASMAHSNKLSKQTINQQAEIAILVLAPILIIFLVFVNWIVMLLYSHKFIAVNEMIYWASLGMFFKTATWAVGFIFLAKGASKIFFLSELLGNSYILALNLLGYYYFGLMGLGMSFLISFFLYLMQVYMIAKVKYDFSYNKSFLKIFGLQLLLAVMSFIVMKLVPLPYNYIVGVIFIITSVSYSYSELNKRMEINSLASNIKKVLSKFKSK